MKTCCFLIPLLSVALFMGGSPAASASEDSAGLPVRKDKKGKKVAAPKKSKVLNIEDARVIIARIQRQKRKFVTAVAGLRRRCQP